MADTHPKRYTETSYGPDAPGVPQTIAEFRRVAETRRSVRIYDGTPVPASVMNACIDLALLAPNSSNLQPWEFYWVRSPEKKKLLVEACLSQPTARTAAELLVCVARTQTWKRGSELMLKEYEKQQAQGLNITEGAKDYYRRDTHSLYEMGMLGLAGLRKKMSYFLSGLKAPTAREPTNEQEMQLWAVKSNSLACQNFMLALRAHGFDSCPMEGFDSVRVRKLLGLPKDAIVNMVISAGKRAPHGVYGPQVRFHRDETVFEV